MSDVRKSVKRWTPFPREVHFEEWLSRILEEIGCTVYRQPVYMASAAHIPSGKYTPKLDLFVMVPAACNSLNKDLKVVIEIKNADNYGHLREAHRQVAAAMAGNDWRSATKNGRQFDLGSRPWRALVVTPGQLRRDCFDIPRPRYNFKNGDYSPAIQPDPLRGYQDWSTEKQRDIAPWAPELWELYDRQLWDHGASLLHMVHPSAWAFRAHVSGQIQIVMIRPANDFL